MANMTDNPTQAASNRVECRTSRDPYIRLFILGIVMLVWAGFSAYDAVWKLDAQGEQKYSPKHNPAGFLFNAGMAVVLPPLAVIALIWANRIRRRRLVADDEGLGYLGKQKIAWNRIKRLVPRGKGLLDVYYEDGNGAQQRLKLDSWMLKGFNELVSFIEAKAPDVPVGEE